MGSGKIKNPLQAGARAAEELIRQEQIDIAHTKKQFMDKMMSKSSESMTRNLSQQTKHAKKSMENLKNPKCFLCYVNLSGMILFLCHFLFTQ